MSGQEGGVQETRFQIFWSFFEGVPTGLYDRMINVAAVILLMVFVTVVGICMIVVAPVEAIMRFFDFVLCKLRIIEPEQQQGPAD